MKIEINDNKKWQYSLTIKMILLAFMGMVLLIPLEMIKSIIRERQKNSEDVKREIGQQWAGPQNISGPVLNIPVMVFPAKKDADPYKSIFHVMPESLIIKGEIQTEKRHRSIYQAVVYTVALKITGDFIIPDPGIAGQTEILWKDAYYTMGISDNRGLKGSVILKADSASLEAVPGLEDAELFNSGISFPAGLSSGNRRLHFSLEFNVSGSEGLSFCPVGKTTETDLVSKWTSPGFKGNFLPSERTINDSGFKARWGVTNLNRNFL